MVCGGVEERLVVQNGQTSRRTGGEAERWKRRGQLWRAIGSHWRVLSKVWHGWDFDAEWELPVNVFCKIQIGNILRLCES